MWYQALQLLFPVSHTFEQVFVAWVGTPSWPYPVSLCLGWCSSLSFYSLIFCAKDKCHLHSNGTHPEQVSMQSDHSSVSWGLYGGEQGHALQMELLVRAHRWVRHESGEAKTGLMYPYCDLNKLHLTTSPSVWIYMALYKLSEDVVWLPSFTCIQDFLQRKPWLGGETTVIHPGLFSAVCGYLASCTMREQDSSTDCTVGEDLIHLWERLIFLYWEYRPLWVNRLLS